MNTHETTERRAKIIGVGKLNVRVNRDRKGRKMKRKVMTAGVLKNFEFADEVGIDFKIIRQLIKGIERVARAGYEVRLGDENAFVRFYPCLDTDYETMYLTAQTCGDLRHSVRDLKFEMTNDGKAIDREEVEEINHEYLEDDDSVNVTPSTMVTCPKCGETFRVGKQLK